MEKLVFLIFMLGACSCIERTMTPVIEDTRQPVPQKKTSTTAECGLEPFFTVVQNSISLVTPAPCTVSSSTTSEVPTVSSSTTSEDPTVSPSTTSEAPKEYVGENDTRSIEAIVVMGTIFVPVMLGAGLLYAYMRWGWPAWRRLSGRRGRYALRQQQDGHEMVVGLGHRQIAHL